MRKLILPILLSLWGLISLSAKEEYWKDFFYLIDGNSYDRAPLFYHPLTEREAESMGNYTVVFLDEQGILKEALTFQSRQPLYYYFYLYDSSSHPMARISYYFQDSDRAIKSSLVYFYYRGNRLYATSYFEYSLLTPGEKMRSFTKIYEEGKDPIQINSFTLEQNPDLFAFLNRTEEVVDQAMKSFQGGELFRRELRD